MKALCVFLAGLFLIGILFLTIGCETPEGGSSLPWGRPEEWEGETNLGISLE